MPESMREAVEGFEREREEKRASAGISAAESMKRFGVAARTALESMTDDERLELWGYRARNRPAPRFRRQDVHDCITAANEQRQLAIASPKSAEQANALATRLSDLAERIAEALEEGE